MAGEPESLDQDEPFEARDRRHAYDRLIMLSDGVFAIAITLLALDVRAPTRWAGGVGGLLAQMAPVLSAFVLSFLVISLYWVLHRRYVAMLMRVDWVAMVLNLAFLGLIALLPAATRLAEYTNGSMSALGLYSMLVVAIGASLALFWGYAIFLGRLVYPEVGARARWCTSSSRSSRLRSPFSRPSQRASRMESCRSYCWRCSWSAASYFSA